MIRIAIFAVILAATTAPGSLAQSSLRPADTAALQFAQHPGAAVPLDAVFRDEDGRSQQLGRYFGHGPVILVLEYLHCTTLCGFVLRDLARGLLAAPQRAGQDYQVVAISIDPRDGSNAAQAARGQYLARFSAADASGWHFLTGDAVQIARVAAAEGFPFRHDDADDQYAHPAGIVVATPDGRVARYLLGIEYRPLDLRLALDEAAGDTIAEPASALLLLCYHYDPAAGRYGIAIANALRSLALVTVLSIAAMVALLARRGRRR